MTLVRMSNPLISSYVTSTIVVLSTVTYFRTPCYNFLFTTPPGVVMFYTI